VSTLGDQAMRLADALSNLADERVADESVVMTAAMVLVARRIAAHATDHQLGQTLAAAAGQQLGMLIALEMHKNRLGV
jgi:hypothetical protein